MRVCENCDKEGIYWLGGWSDAEAYCLEHWVINQKEPVKALREQIAREIMENFDGGHIKGENGCSCQEDSDPCYFCGAKDYTRVAAAIARDGHEPNQVTKDAIEEARKMK